MDPDTDTDANPEVMANLSYEEIPNNEALKSKYHPSFRNDFAKIGGYFVLAKYKKYADAIMDFEVRNDDVFVISPPKCGTTWVQEMVWCISSNCDLYTAKNISISNRFPFLELSGMASCVNLDSTSQYMKDSVGWITQLKERRFIKSHLPHNLLPRQLQKNNAKAKIVFVVRDPRDACISFYHHQTLLLGYEGNLGSFVNHYLNDSVIYSPYWSQVTSYWDRRDSPNLLLLTYEDMKKDLASVIRRTAQFLDVMLTDDQIELLKEHLSFESMRNNAAVNYESATKKISHLLDGPEGKFMRQGEAGAYKRTLDAEQILRFQTWTRESLRGRDDVLPEYHY